MAKESNYKLLSLPTALMLIFLTLKLANIGVVASWSWWWIFSPIWIHFLLVVLVATFIVLLGKREEKKESEWESKLNDLIKRIKEEEATKKQ